MLVVICSDPLVQRSGPARLGGGGGKGSNCEDPGHYSSNSPLSDHLLPGHNIHIFFLQFLDNVGMFAELFVSILATSKTTQTHFLITSYVV